MKHKIISIPPVYFLTCIIITLLLHVLVSSLNWIGFPFTLVGVAFLGAGTYWIARAHRLLTQHATPVTFAPSTCIIQGGLYHYSRNPMYVGFVVFLIGCSVLSGNILSVLSPLCFFVVLDRMFIPYRGRENGEHVWKGVSRIQTESPPLALKRTPLFRPVLRSCGPFYPSPVIWSRGVPPKRIPFLASRPCDPVPSSASQLNNRC